MLNLSSITPPVLHSDFSFVLWQLMQAGCVDTHGQPKAWPSLKRMTVSDLLELRLVLPAEWAIPIAPAQVLAASLLADRLGTLDLFFEGKAKESLLNWGQLRWASMGTALVGDVLGVFGPASTARRPLPSTCAAYLEAWFEYLEQNATEQ